MKNVSTITKQFSRILGGILFYSAFAGEAWAMAAPGGEEKSPGGALGLFAPMILVFLIFYFLLIRPQAKQQKKHQALLKQLQRGDEVVTAAGIHGKITSVTDDTVGVEIADNVRIRVDKKQIARVKSEQPEAPKSK